MEETSDCRNHSKDGAEPAGTEGFQEPGSAGPKQPQVCRGAPFCFAFCLFGGDFIQPKKISTRDSSSAPTHGPNAVTTAGRIFSTLGKSEYNEAFSNYISQFSSPPLILYPIRLSPLSTTLCKALKAFSPIFPY